MLLLNNPDYDKHSKIFAICLLIAGILFIGTIIAIISNSDVIIEHRIILSVFFGIFVVGFIVSSYKEWIESDKEEKKTGST